MQSRRVLNLAVLIISSIMIAAAYRCLGIVEEPLILLAGGDAHSSLALLEPIALVAVVPLYLLVTRRAKKRQLAGGAHLIAAVGFGMLWSVHDHATIALPYAVWISATRLVSFASLWTLSLQHAKKGSTRPLAMVALGTMGGNLLGAQVPPLGLHLAFTLSGVALLFAAVCAWFVSAETFAPPVGPIPTRAWRMRTLVAAATWSALPFVINLLDSSGAASTESVWIANVIALSVLATAVVLGSVRAHTMVVLVPLIALACFVGHVAGVPVVREVSNGIAVLIPIVYTSMFRSLPIPVAYRARVVADVGGTVLGFVVALGVATSSADLRTSVVGIWVAFAVWISVSLYLRSRPLDESSTTLS